MSRQPPSRPSLSGQPPCGELPRGKPPYRAFCGVLLAGAAVLAACASAPTRFFTLDPVAPAALPAVAYAGPPVKLTAVHIPPALDREELVSETGGGEVRVHDFEHWEAPLGLTARQALVQDLAARLPAGSVLGPSEPGGDGAAILSADIVSFQSGPQGATMQVAWSVTLPGAAGPSYSAPLSELRTMAVAADGSGTAQAFSALLGQLSDQIAATLPQQVQRLAAERMQAEAAARAAAAPARTTVRTTSTTTAVHR